MKIDTEKDHFDDMTKYLSAEGRYFVLDAIACTFHNEGHSLVGNTAENDVLWLARQISERMYHKKLEMLDDEQTRRVTVSAEVSMKALPALAERIASRYIDMSKAIRTIERISCEQTRQLRQELREKRGA